MTAPARPVARIAPRDGQYALYAPDGSHVRSAALAYDLCALAAGNGWQPAFAVGGELIDAQSVIDALPSTAAELDERIAASRPRQRQSA